MSTKQRAEQVLGPSHQVLATAVVRLYVSVGSNWEFSKITGIATLALNTSESTKFIHIIELPGNTTPFSQELYDNFNYDAPRDFFHSFEMDDCVAGLSFADVADAKEFLRTVKANSMPPKPALPRSSLPPVPPTPAPRAPSSPQPTPPSKPTPPPVAAPTPTPAPVAAPVPAPAPVVQTAPPPAKPAPQQAKKPKQGFFSKLKSAMTGEPSDDFVISEPENFRHQSHIGWDPDAGFEIRNIPPDWRKLFQAAGVKKSELRDAETAKFVMSVIGDTISASGGTPPPMPMGMGAPSAPAAPPAPPPPAGNAPPPPPPPPAGGPPPPPAPPGPPKPAAPRGDLLSSIQAGTQLKSAPAAAPPQQNSRGDLMSAIQQGAQLRKVEPNQPLPDIGKLSDAQSNSLAGTLAAAMASRRIVMDDEPEEEDDDVWSD